VFIAQPPLYKVKKNRQERYVKDDDELNAYFLELALQDAKLFVNPDAPAIQGEPLEALVGDFQQLLKDLAPSSRKYPEEISRALLRVGGLDETLMSNQAAMSEWAETLREALEEDASKDAAVEVGFDNELNVYSPTISLLLKGRRKTVTLTKNFVDGFEYQQISAMRTRLENLLEAGAFVQRGDKTTAIVHFSDAFEWLQSEARRGVDIQRYKGLGEMNPEQLWETTMDQNVRRMLRVTVDDAIGADQMFTTLMGELVEPRREFIESNALSVVNLDV
jgi:DNA gyrase subunit B